MEQPTLFKELGDWNRQENTFRQLFSPDALKDREFMRMKLQAYDRLFHRYSGKPLTTDEQALMRMLQFQRRKMERALFRGLISRLLRKGASLVRGIIIRQREAAIARRGALQQYITAPMPADPATPQAHARMEARETSLRQYPLSKFEQQRKQRRPVIKKKGL